MAREVDARAGELGWSERLLPPNPPGVEVEGVCGRPLMLVRALGRPATARGRGRPSASSSSTSAASSVSLSGSSRSGSSSTAAAAAMADCNTARTFGAAPAPTLDGSAAAAGALGMWPPPATMSDSR